MKWVKDLKISSKLIVGFIAIALIAAVVGVYGIAQIRTINDNYTKMYDNQTKPLGDLANIGMQFHTVQVELRDCFIDTNNLHVHVKNIDNAYGKISTDITEYQKHVTDEKERERINEFLYLYKEIRPLYKEITDFLAAGDYFSAQIIMLSKVEPKVKDMTFLINLILDKDIKDAKLIAEENAAKAAKSRFTMIVLVASAFVLSVVLGILISRTISRPINKMVEASNKLALGDVDVNVEVKTKDEVGRLGESFNKMIANIRKQALAAERLAGGDLTVEIDINSENDLLGKKLHELVEKNNVLLNNINIASTQLAASAKQLSESNFALSQGATEQASSIEELTASIEQITAQTNINAENAARANELAELAKNNAEQGNKHMEEMLLAMQEIKESSEKIYKIIKVIDDIAFQTNILALNAAVEAARAGEHGKGFAVVADEVRNLAVRSAEAAKETADMIGRSIKKVQSGTSIANDTAEALKKIVEGIKKAASFVTQIAVSSKEQAAGISQINQSIAQVSQVVSTNSATAEEGAAASEELSSQAEFLKRTVAKFKLKNNQNITDIDSLDDESEEIEKILDTLCNEEASELMSDEGLLAEEANGAAGSSEDSANDENVGVSDIEEFVSN